MSRQRIAAARSPLAAHGVHQGRRAGDSKNGAQGRNDAAERGYAGLVARLVRHSLVTAAFGLGLGAIAMWGLAALPTGFIPIEDQGYVIAGVQLPEGVSLERTERVMDRITTIVRGTPGVEHAVAIGGISVLDNNASLANAGATYVILKDWRERGRGQDLRSLYPKLADELSKLE